MHRHRDYRPDDETGGLLRTARVSVRAGRMLGAGLDPVELGPSGRLVLEVHLVDVDVGDLGRRDVLLGEDRVDGARIDACTAIDALIRVDENHPVIVGLVDAVHGADLDAGLVLQVDASLSDDVGHAGWSLAKAEALSSIARGEGPLPGTGTGGPWGCSRVPTRSDERHRALPARSEGVDEPPPELHRHRAAVGHGPVGARGRARGRPGGTLEHGEAAVEAPARQARGGTGPCGFAPGGRLSMAKPQERLAKVRQRRRRSLEDSARVATTTACAFMLWTAASRQAEAAWTRCIQAESPGPSFQCCLTTMRVLSPPRSAGHNARARGGWPWAMPSRATKGPPARALARWVACASRCAKATVGSPPSPKVSRASRASMATSTTLSAPPSPGVAHGPTPRTIPPGSPGSGGRLAWQRSPANSTAVVLKVSAIWVSD